MTKPVSTPNSDTKASPNWRQIEADYRAGVKSLRQIAEENGITHGAVNKRAKRDDWTRDLAAKIRAKADALVSKASVSTEESAAKLATEKQTVEAAATTQANVRISQRKDVERSRTLAMTLLTELEAQTTKPEVFAQIEQDLAERKAGEELTPAARARMSEGLAKALSLAGRIATFKALADALRTTIALEREAYGIDSRTKVDETDPITALLRGIGASALPIVSEDPAHKQ